jgi:hypothetical protein
MRKKILAVATALALGAVTMSTGAMAFGHGGAHAAGVVGGHFAGAARAGGVGGAHWNGGGHWAGGTRNGDWRGPGPGAGAVALGVGVGLGLGSLYAYADDPYANGYCAYPDDNGYAYACGPNSYDR